MDPKEISRGSGDDYELSTDCGSTSVGNEDCDCSTAASVDGFDRQRGQSKGSLAPWHEENEPSTAGALDIELGSARCSLDGDDETVDFAFPSEQDVGSCFDAGDACATEQTEATHCEEPQELQTDSLFLPNGHAAELVPRLAVSSVTCGEYRPSGGEATCAADISVDGWGSAEGVISKLGDLGLERFVDTVSPPLVPECTGPSEAVSALGDWTEQQHNTWFEEFACTTTAPPIHSFSEYVKEASFLSMNPMLDARNVFRSDEETAHEQLRETSSEVVARLDPLGSQVNVPGTGHSLHTNVRSVASDIVRNLTPQPEEEETDTWKMTPEKHFGLMDWGDVAEPEENDEAKHIEREENQDEVQVYKQALEDYIEHGVLSPRSAVLSPRSASPVRGGSAALAGSQRLAASPERTRPPMPPKLPSSKCDGRSGSPTPPAKPGLQVDSHERVRSVAAEVMMSLDIMNDNNWAGQMLAKQAQEEADAKAKKLIQKKKQAKANSARTAGEPQYASLAKPAKDMFSDLMRLCPTDQVTKQRGKHAMNIISEWESDDESDEGRAVAHNEPASPTDESKAEQATRRVYFEDDEVKTESPLLDITGKAQLPVGDLPRGKGALRRCLTLMREAYNEQRNPAGALNSDEFATDPDAAGLRRECDGWRARCKGLWQEVQELQQQIGVVMEDCAKAAKANGASARKANEDPAASLGRQHVGSGGLEEEAMGQGRRGDGADFDTDLTDAAGMGFIDFASETSSPWAAVHGALSEAGNAVSAVASGRRGIAAGVSAGRPGGGVGAGGAAAVASVAGGAGSGMRSPVLNKGGFSFGSGAPMPAARITPSPSEHEGWDAESFAGMSVSDLSWNEDNASVAAMNYSDDDSSAAGTSGPSHAGSSVSMNDYMSARRRPIVGGGGGGGGARVNGGAMRRPLGTKKAASGQSNNSNAPASLASLSTSPSRRSSFGGGSSASR
jgi:hypothetical protein